MKCNTVPSIASYFDFTYFLDAANRQIVRACDGNRHRAIPSRIIETKCPSSHRRPTCHFAYFHESINW